MKRFILLLLISLPFQVFCSQYLGKSKEYLKGFFASKNDWILISDEGKTLRFDNEKTNMQIFLNFNSKQVCYSAMTVFPVNYEDGIRGELDKNFKKISEYDWINSKLRIKYSIMLMLLDDTHYASDKKILSATYY